MLAVFDVEFLGCDCGAGENGPWYRVSFISGMDKLIAYADKDIFDQAQKLGRLDPIMLGVDIQERKSGGWSGRVKQIRLKK